MNTASAPVAPGSILPLFPEGSGVRGGELVIGGCTVGELAERFGTPAYLFDESALRGQVRRFVGGLASRWPDSEVLFASKSFPAVAMYALAQSEGLSVDVAGGGELMMALAAGVDPARIYQHGSAKTDAEIKMALDAGVGTIIVDNTDDLDRIEQFATRPQHVLVRVIPGVDPETHHSQATGGTESKFGLPLDQVRAAIRRIDASPVLRMDGIHLHIGSQILDARPFAHAIEAIAEIGQFPVYDIGGGLGVRYVRQEEAPSVEEYLDTVTAAAREHLPAGSRLLIEPGRSIVARSGTTLYRVTTVKRTGRVFVAVDGGMADNLEVSLTGQRFEAVVANRMDVPARVRADVVGRQCESGDRLVADAELADPRVGDLIAVPVTGAYTYTMANHYNGALTPPIVFCRDGEARLVAERQSYADLLRPHQPALAIDWGAAAGRGSR